MTRDNKKIIETVKKIQDDLIQNPLKEGEQLNLSGYSYGSVLQAQVALVLVEKGQKVDNLILIGSPVAIDSPLYQKLLKAQEDGMIGQIIREDIEGDKLSNSTSDMSMLGGAFQNLGEDGPHFDFARPDNKETPDIDEGKETEKRIKELGEKLKKKGVN